VQTASFAQTLTAITVEGVSDYATLRSRGWTAGDIDCLNQTQKFYNTMTAANTGWTVGKNWQDDNVYDTDFRDPDVAGANGADNDSSNFDWSYTAIALACGHGSCDDALTTNCTSSANCSAGQYCMGNPPSANSSRCTNGSPRRFQTSSSSSKFGDQVMYGDGHTKLGETATWGGAGTNGGDMVAFIFNSCGVRPPYYFGQTGPMFAGVTQLNMIMPVSNVANAGSADAVVYSDRGLKLAQYAIANPNSAVSGGWFNNIDTAPQTTGGSCPDRTATYTNGGGHGISGCGAHISIAWDSVPTFANWDVDKMRWVDARNPGLRSAGIAAGYARYHCNYDCLTYPFTK